MSAQLATQHNPPAVLSDSASLMAAIARAAADPNVDVGKMERLFVMHERMQDRQASQDYAEAMKAVQAESPKIGKDRRNEQTSSDYATLDAIHAVIAPIYTAHGLSLSFDTEDSPLAEHVRIVCHVQHTNGHKETFRYDTPMDSTGIAGKVNKTLTHARGSAVTYGRRYLTLMIFNLSTGKDDDGNGATEPVSDELNARANDFEIAIRDAIDMTELARIGSEVAKSGLPPKLQTRVRDSYKAKSHALKGVK